MDNIKKFEDFLDRMQGLLDSAKKQGHIIVRVEDLENTFPELAESEDERIRKALIDYFDDANKADENLLQSYGIHTDKAIAWLEKQSTPQVRTGLEWLNTIDDACDKRYAEEYAHGEYCHEQSFKWGFQEGVDWLEKQGEPTDINPSEFDLRLNKLLKQFETLPKEELASSLSFYLNVVQNDGTYKAEEKQGEQKLPINDFKAKDWYVSKVDGKIRNIYYSVDKVEPKFKVGDWIVYREGIWKIGNIALENYYELLKTNNEVATRSIKEADENAHLWTIQDAKDGDILVSKYNRPFIYNGNRDFFHVGSYCGLSTSDKFIVSTSKCFWTKNVSILPATKEQRELLFKEMKEAGYEWDSEHKQLKKIETMDKYEGLTDFERTLTDICIGWIGEEIGWKQYIKDNADILLKIAVEKFNSVQDATFEQKPADWSEEDEDIRDTIIRDLKRLGGDIVNVKTAYKAEIDWLKSLKPQNHWKPTKEQMEALHDLNLTGNISYAGQGQVLIELYKQLEKL